MLPEIVKPALEQYTVLQFFLGIGSLLVVVSIVLMSWRKALRKEGREDDNEKHGTGWFYEAQNAGIQYARDAVRCLESIAKSLEEINEKYDPAPRRRRR